MSRSNPHAQGSLNPAVRWFEWNGETGTVRYYDKDAKQNVDCGSSFIFLLLDELATVRGWHDASDSGICANEVKDTRQEVLVVKSFKGGILAEGLYADIKDRVNRAGGQFVANCYIAFKLDGALAIGSIRFKGAALSAWMEFKKAHRREVYEGAVAIKGFTEGKKGRIVYRAPIFHLAPLSADSQAEAVALDRTLQAFLADYLAHSTRKDAARAVARQEPDEPPPPSDDDAPPPDLDDIPF